MYIKRSKRALNRMYNNMYPLYILLPSTLDSFPTRMFSVRRRTTICYGEHYIRKQFMCVLRIIYMY